MITFSPSRIKKEIQLVSPFIHIPENVNSFDFDAIVFDECFILKNIAGYIFKKFLLTSSLKINEEQLAKFIGLVCENYNRNHFHNFQHAVNILQMTYNLLLETNLIDKLKPIIVFGILIAAISHDIDHPGNTNSYEINSVSKYARLYNDSSVLENHHCTLTFELLEHTGLLSTFKGNEFTEFRKTIISGILGTDMTKHNDCINKLTTFDVTCESFKIEQQYFITSFILHCADLSNSIKNFDISFEWSKRISIEFYEQTVKEELEGLPSLSFMKVHDNLSMCVNEISFITNVSIPMWKVVKSKFENLGFLLERCQNILKKWKEIEAHYISENDINTLNY
jgi:hypothetical protein